MRTKPVGVSKWYRTVDSSQLPPGHPSLFLPVEGRNYPPSGIKRFPYLIPIRGYRRKLDRIRLTVRNAMGVFPELVSMLGSNFSFLKQDRIIDMYGERKIRRYEYWNGHIDLIKWKEPEKQFWFGIDIHDPDRKIQLQLVSLLHPFISRGAPGKPSVGLSEVEVALDVFPKEVIDLFPLAAALRQKLCLRRASAGSFRRTFNTHHHGELRGRWRGLRDYPKLENGEYFFRIEVQLNDHYISRRLGLSVDDLPLDADITDPLDHVVYRDGIRNMNAVECMLFHVDEFCYSSIIPSDHKKLPRKGVSREDVFAFKKDQIFERLIGTVLDGPPTWNGRVPNFHLPVAYQLSALKDFMLNRTKQSFYSDSFFSKNGFERILPRWLEKGFVPWDGKPWCW